jgi:hypothetical protein
LHIRLNGNRTGKMGSMMKETAEERDCLVAVHASVQEFNPRF